jgi:polyisoprenoid-binding protein YceI
MKTITFLISAFVLLVTSPVIAQSAKVDVDKSTVKWFATKVTGSHNGTIKIKSGELVLKQNSFVSGNFIIDMNSIVDSDLSDAGYNQKLVGHLKSDDFFAVATYPEAKLVILKSTEFKGNKAIVQANLTIKAKTNQITFDAVKTAQGYQAKIVVDRSKYDVKYGSNSFFDNLGDKAISDEFTLDVDLVVKGK